MAGDPLAAKLAEAATDYIALATENAELRAVVSRLLTPRNEVEFKLGSEWAMRDQLWSYMPVSDAELALLTNIVGED